MTQLIFYYHECLSISQWWSSHKLVFPPKMPCKIFWSPSFSPTRCHHVSRIRRPDTSLSLLRMIMAYQAVMEGEGLRKGSWLEDEDERLTTFVTLMGERRWDSIARASGLKRSGKSCRLRWLNYLRPNLKHGDISMEEERIILQLHELWGNKWSRIARSLPGRTDNEIKNYWRTHLRKKVEAQEEGNFVCKLSNAEQDMYDYENHGGSVGDLLGTTDNSSDDLAGLSNFELTSSPYETRLLDWISELSNDQSEIKHHEDYCINSLESCFCYPAWIPDDHSSDTWNCSAGSLWAMD